MGQEYPADLVRIDMSPVWQARSWSRPYSFMRWFCVMIQFKGGVMKKLILMFLVVLMGSIPFSQAFGKSNDGPSSELGHAAGGAVIAGAATYVADAYWPDLNRGWAGFCFSALAGCAGEAAQWASGSEFSLLDAASHAAGAALGAWVTDRFILLPVIRITSQDKVCASLVASFTF